jgi:poly-gamma-glutamate synthesis protein (capsule biosynthesis protein)
MKTVLAAGLLMLAAGGTFFLFVLRDGSVALALDDVFTPAPVFLAADTDARIFAAGDMLFDRNIRYLSGLYGEDHPFSCIDELIKTADFAVANLEGPITEHTSKSIGSVPGSPDNYFFTFPTTTAALLNRHHFEVVGIGNNHITNFGIEGLHSTQRYLARAGVGYFGGIDGDEGVYEAEVHGVPLSFVGYNEFGGSSPQQVAGIIAEEHSEGRRVIVYTHWGDEYVDSSPRLRPVAELFAQSGASAVIGSHPHVVLGHEYIGETLVYYSLGNFIFDQYWNKDVRSGLALVLSVPKEGRVVAEEHPVEILRDGRTCPAVQEKGF